MTKRYRGTNHRYQRNLQSAGWRALCFTGRSAERVAVGMARWATKDHLGTNQSLLRVLSMGLGFIETIKLLLLVLLAQIAGAIVSGVLMFILIAYGIPFLFTVAFG